VATFGKKKNKRQGMKELGERDTRSRSLRKNPFQQILRTSPGHEEQSKFLGEKSTHLGSGDERKKGTSNQGELRTCMPLSSRTARKTGFGRSAAWRWPSKESHYRASLAHRPGGGVMTGKPVRKRKGERVSGPAPKKKVRFGSSIPQRKPKGKTFGQGAKDGATGRERRSIFERFGGECGTTPMEKR